MTGRLTGKTALLTAAGQGIGRATALAFAAEGAQVIATDINDALLEELAGLDATITTSHMDVLRPSTIERVASAHPTVDVLFNCAGYVHHGTVFDCSADQLQYSFDLNVASMHRTISTWLPAMLTLGRGSIINMASVASSLKGVPNRFAYGTTKAAVIGLTKAVAADYVGQGIRCNAICPGTVQSPSLDARIAALPDPEQGRRDFIARQPMGRLGTPEEIANLAVYLASDEASYTTGAVHVIDGGWDI